ncbi:hypothetical protein Tsubulata_011696 [Turnera subulata]|uniref:Exopolygalacturonase-like n=1 Tax=Turnera subulata TaxID=218843 RepID=A0A9Q0JLE0_9ROSI|nr:hypothetical protein Tsubulata_011696 [Turnera subulata]
MEPLLWGASLSCTPRKNIEVRRGKRMAAMRSISTNVKSVVATAVLLCLMMASSCEASALDHPARKIGKKRDPTEKVFNVLSFDAKPDGEYDNQMEFMQTWLAACKHKGKARVLVPMGKFVLGPVVFSGPCQTEGPIIVQVVGTVMALPDITSYEEDFWFQFENVHGVILTGTGTFDGQGAQNWKVVDNCGGNCVHLPISIKFIRVTQAIVRQITSLNPMGFHIGVVLCENIRIRNVKLYAPGDSPNTDGIHISQSTMVKVARSTISTGDDCVGIIQGSVDVSIKKVTCGPGHGFSVGSLGKYKDEKDVRQIVVTNCTLKDTDNGLRIKTFANSPPSMASDFTFRDIIMENVKHPIIIDQFYGSNSHERYQVHKHQGNLSIRSWSGSSMQQELSL